MKNHLLCICVSIFRLKKSQPKAKNSLGKHCPHLYDFSWNFQRNFKAWAHQEETLCVTPPIKNASTRSSFTRPAGGSGGALDLTAQIGAKTRIGCVHSVPRQWVCDCPSCSRRWELLGAGYRKDRQEGSWRIFLDLGTRCGRGTLRTWTFRVSPVEGQCSGNRMCWYPQGVLVLILLWKLGLSYEWSWFWIYDRLFVNTTWSWNLWTL